MRTRIIIFVIAVFCFQYAAYLYVLANVRPINPNYMQVWRQIPFYLYASFLWYMALNCSDKIERAMIKTGGAFLLLVCGVVLMDALDIYKNGLVSLFFASVVTGIFGIQFYRNAVKYGYI